MRRSNFSYLVLCLVAIACSRSEKEQSYTSPYHNLDRQDLLIDDNWLSRSLFPKPVKVKAGNDSSIRLKGAVLGRNYITQAVAVEHGKFYRFSLDVLNYNGRSVNMGISAISKGEVVAMHFLQNREYVDKKTLSIKFVATASEVEIKVGFRKWGMSKATFANLKMTEVPQLTTSFQSPFATNLAHDLDLHPFDSAGYHKNVLKIVRYVNVNLISPLRNYYHYQGSAEEKQSFLEQEEIKRKLFSDSIELYLPTSRFAGYSNLLVTESANSYCKQSSLSSHDVLNEFNIPAHQLHMFEGDVGFHQFIEYWHPYSRKWIIIDPFYGITYKDRNNNLIGYEEFNKLVKSNAVTIDNVKHEEIEKFYFDQNELSKGWDARIKNVYFNDMKKTFAH